MVLTILEAHVEEQYWAQLPKVYVELAIDWPDGLLHSYLAQDKKQPKHWRILTFWQDQESLDAMRANGQTPTGVLIFQRVNSTPELRIFDIRQQTEG